MQTIRVNLESRRYQIAVAAGLMDAAGLHIRGAVGDKARNAVIVSNPTVSKLYGLRLERSLKRAGFTTHRVLAGDGEKFKTIRSAELLYTFLIERRIERGDLILALGGGVIGDLAGFAAATYLRGIKLIQIPTTLLAQIDSSIGGKTGVNHRLGKNLIGSFHQPALVLIDPEALITLPARELRSGLFEAIKYGVIKDKKLFDHIGANIASLKSADTAELTPLIVSSCRIKAEVVEKDERESGLRRILNFGHTVGHALEAITSYRRFLHGEAVAYGMRAASRMAELMGLFDPYNRKAVEDIISSVGSLPNARNLASRDIMVSMKRDKKVEAGKLAFVLPVDVGRVVIRSDVPPAIVRKALIDTLA
jgi:3-dehydroquinate synthase